MEARPILTHGLENKATTRKRTSRGSPGVMRFVDAFVSYWISRLATLFRVWVPDTFSVNASPVVNSPAFICAKDLMVKIRCCSIRKIVEQASTLPSDLCNYLRTAAFCYMR